MAVGSGAQANAGVGEASNRTDAVRLAEALVEAVRSRRAELSHPEEAESAAAAVGEELRSEQPDAGSLLKTLSRLSATVQPVASLVDAVASLQHAVAGLF
jgi:translation initiation factor 2B subunit (eIF-2B alpha/beta/delta family)